MTAPGAHIQSEYAISTSFTEDAVLAVPPEVSAVSAVAEPVESTDAVSVAVDVGVVVPVAAESLSEQETKDAASAVAEIRDRRGESFRIGTRNPIGHRLKEEAGVLDPVNGTSRLAASGSDLAVAIERRPPCDETYCPGHPRRAGALLNITR